MKVKAALKSIMQSLQGRKEVEAKQICVNEKRVRGKSGEILSTYGLHHQESSPQWVMVEEQRWGRKMAIARKGDEQKQREQIPTLI